MSEIRDISLGENRKRFRQFFAIYFPATALIEIQRDYFAVVSGKNTVVNIYRNIERAGARTFRCFAIVTMLSPVMAAMFVDYNKSSFAQQVHNITEYTILYCHVVVCIF